MACLALVHELMATLKLCVHVGGGGGGGGNSTCSVMAGMISTNKYYCGGPQ